jgi:hypothetical protein
MDAATAAVLALAAGTFIAACFANIFAFRTFREARRSTEAQKKTLLEQQQATHLERQAVAEAQHATRIAINARREEKLARRLERLTQVGECLGELFHATVSYPVTARAHACSVAIDRLGVSLASLTDLDLPRTAALARFMVREGDAQTYPLVPDPDAYTTALTEVQGIAAMVRDALQTIQHDEPEQASVSN